MHVIHILSGTLLLHADLRKLTKRQCATYMMQMDDCET